MCHCICFHINSQEDVLINLTSVTVNFMLGKQESAQSMTNEEPNIANCYEQWVFWGCDCTGVLFETLKLMSPVLWGTGGKRTAVLFLYLPVLQKME